MKDPEKPLPSLSGGLESISFFFENMYIYLYVYMYEQFPQCKVHSYRVTHYDFIVSSHFEKSPLDLDCFASIVNHNIL